MGLARLQQRLPHLGRGAFAALPAAKLVFYVGLAGMLCNPALAATAACLSELHQPSCSVLEAAAVPCLAHMQVRGIHLNLLGVLVAPCRQRCPAGLQHICLLFEMQVADNMHALGQTSAAHSLARPLQARELIRQQEALPEPEGEIEFIEVPDTRERWDCESVLSVSSNLHNHPGRIAEPRQRSAAGIRLSRKTGGPVGHVWVSAVRCGPYHLPQACRCG